MVGFCLFRCGKYFVEESSSSCWSSRKLPAGDKPGRHCGLFKVHASAHAVSHVFLPLTHWLWFPFWLLSSITFIFTNVWRCTKCDQKHLTFLGVFSRFNKCEEGWASPCGKMYRISDFMVIEKWCTSWLLLGSPPGFHWPVHHLSTSENSGCLLTNCYSVIRHAP